MMPAVLSRKLVCMCACMYCVHKPLPSRLEQKPETLMNSANINGDRQQEVINIEVNTLPFQNQPTCIGDKMYLYGYDLAYWWVANCSMNMKCKLFETPSTHKDQP